MNLTRAVIRIMRAILESDITELSRKEGLDRESGLFIVDNGRGLGLEGLRAIVQELDYRIEVFDAERTNLNDLEVQASPLREAAGHAYRSEHQHVFVLRGWVPAMRDDPRIQTYRRMFGGAGIAVILSPLECDPPSGFVSCDLSGL